MSMKSKYKSGYKKHSNHATNRIAFVVISVLLVIGVISCCGFLFISTNTDHSKSTQEYTVTTYLAKENITHGQTITSSMLQEVQITPDMLEDYYCTIDCLGDIAIVDIPQGMILSENMLRLPDLEQEQREVECEIITLSENLTENDYVDVRIMMPNGEDYIVLAKKGVHDLVKSEEEILEKCYLWMSEDEILYYSAAIVDAYLYSGASIYTTKYIEPTIQEPSLVTYVPSLGTIKMMKENPNLVQEAIQYLKEDERKQLENRLTDYLTKDVREILWKEEEKPIEDLTNEEKPTVGNEDTMKESDDQGDIAESEPPMNTQNTQEQEVSAFVEDSSEKED